jgi:hypothetical protein
MKRSNHWLLWGAFLSSLFLVLPCGYSERSLNETGSFLSGTISVAHADDTKKSVTIKKLKVEPLYKSVRLTWKLKKGEKTPMTFNIYRSMANSNGPYKLVTSIERKPGVKKYKYLDKSLLVEENYFYKLTIPETKETFGPFQVRPPFSLPTT